MLSGSQKCGNTVCRCSAMLFHRLWFASCGCLSSWCLSMVSLNSETKCILPLSFRCDVPQIHRCQLTGNRKSASFPTFNSTKKTHKVHRPWVSELITLLCAPAEFEQMDLKAAGTRSVQGTSAAEGDKKRGAWRCASAALHPGRLPRRPGETGKMKLGGRGCGPCVIRFDRPSVLTAGRRSYDPRCIVWTPSGIPASLHQQGTPHHWTAANLVSLPRSSQWIWSSFREE